MHFGEGTLKYEGENSKAIEMATREYSKAVRESEEVKQMMVTKNIAPNKLKNVELTTLLRPLNVRL